MNTSGVALGIHGLYTPSSQLEEQPVDRLVLGAMAGGQLWRALMLASSPTEQQ